MRPNETKIIEIFQIVLSLYQFKKKNTSILKLFYTHLYKKVKKYLEDEEKRHAFFYFISFSYIHNWLQNPLIRAKKVFEKILKKRGEKRVEE